MVNLRLDPVLDEVRDLVAAVPDPELPMVTIADLGILREVELVDQADVDVRVTITPTYAGCPAMDAIRADIESALAPRRVRVETVLSPPWTTDDITIEGRTALATHGIAPPGPLAGVVSLTLTRRCPNCGSTRTRELSRFGSTACKALWVCEACSEPFDLFKEHG